MSTNRTAEETKDENCAAMGDDLGTLFSVLSQDLTSAHLYWEQFVELYGSAPSRVTILNEAAPQFFWMTQQLLWNEALLGICRLTAPLKSYNKPNLTIRGLAPLVGDPALKSAVEAKVEQVVQAAKFANDWRNRRIAHRDLSLALGKSPDPLAPATRLAVDTCFAGLAEVMNMIALHYTNATTSYSFIISEGGAKALLYCLRDGLRRDEERREATRNGRYDPRLYNDDIGPV